MEFLIFLIIIVLCICYFRIVPPDTVVIVDRNSHYLKTKKHGIYFFNPKTDKVTTEISTNKLSKYYSNIFETDDGKVVYISFYATYHAENIDSVLNSLKSARRSIYDIMNSSIYWATNNLNEKDIIDQKNALLYKEAYEKLISEARVLNISIDEFLITSISRLSNSSNNEPFKPHLNSYTQGPIRYK